MGPELLMPSSPFRTTFLPGRFCPLPLVCNPCAYHILPFTPVHHPSFPLSQSPQHSLWNRHLTTAKGSIKLGVLLSPTLSFTVAHPFKTNLWAVLKLGSNVFFPSLFWSYDGTMHDQYHNSIMQTEVNSLAAFQIPSLKGRNCWPCYKLEGIGKMTVYLASPVHSWSSLFPPRFFGRDIPECWTISSANNHRTSLWTCFPVSFC